jgi:hypothetical protein
MSVLQELRQCVGDYLELRAIKTHRSRLGRHDAGRYSDYLRECQAKFAGPLRAASEVGVAVEEFGRKNVASFWTPENGELARGLYAELQRQEGTGDVWNERRQYRGDVYRAFPQTEALFRGSVGDFLRSVFRSHFKLYFGTLYKSERAAKEPSGSELWHADGGPGTCVILMVYLKDVVREDGALECLPWEQSVAVYRGERATFRRRLREQTAGGRRLDGEQMRKIRCDYFAEMIDRHYRRYVEQPVGQAGLVVAFGNNVLHKGGYPAPGRRRCVALFHCYPSDKPTPFERYRVTGIPKVESYPKDPAAEF